MENDLVVLVEYQMQEPCSATGGKRWFSRIDDSGWWTIAEEAARVGRTESQIKSSIKHKRPTHVVCNAYFVVGGPMCGQWLTRGEIVDAFGYARETIAGDCNSETGIYTWRQPDPTKAAYGKKATEAKQVRAAGGEYENKEIRRRKWVSKTTRAFEMFMRLPVFN